MKKASLISFAVFFMMAAQAVSKGDWCDVEIVPEHPNSCDVVAITLSGWWSNSCTPNDSTVSVVGNNIYFDVIWDYPPGIMCLMVITPWGRTESVGPLSPGTYTVYARIVGYPRVPDYEPVAEFIVADKQFVLSTESLVVPEGQTATFTVNLMMDPCEIVAVFVARKSGDPDITLASGDLLILLFDSSNYSIPRTVTLVAAEDEDFLNGTAIISVSALNYVTAELVAKESDNDTTKIIYVDADAPGNNTGRSWEDAYADLQEALSVARVVPEIEEIKVARGVYGPAGPGGDRNATFKLINGVTLKGGYAGFGELDPAARNVGKYKTILSGDLNGDDVGGLTDLSRNENSYNVVKGIKLNKTAVLDGFIITGGYGKNGSGIYISGGAGPIISNCIVCCNWSGDCGGGIYNWASAALINCILSGNSANKGGGMYSHAGSPVLTNCTLSRNTAGSNGGGLYVYGRGGNPKLTNCILWANSDSGGTDESAQAHIIYTYESTTVINYCCVQGWTATLVGTGSIGDDPLFANLDNNDYHLKSQAGRWDPGSQSWVQDGVTSPCIDAGDIGNPIGFEPFPNGGIINMGGYGSTTKASKSYFGSPLCTTVVAGDINGDCRVDFLDFTLMSLHWLEDNNP